MFYSTTWVRLLKNVFFWTWVEILGKHLKLSTVTVYVISIRHTLKFWIFWQKRYTFKFNSKIWSRHKTWIIFTGAFPYYSAHRRRHNSLSESFNYRYVFLFQVTDCHLVTDPRSKESRGFAFVTMATNEDAERCVKYLNRSVLEGRLITVEKV